jgi:hypothetical protein
MGRRHQQGHPDGTATTLYPEVTVHPSTTAERLAWQSYADACLEHDGRHGKRAAAEVTNLRQVPDRRPSRTGSGGRTLRG